MNGITSLRSEDISARWLRFLSRWALLVVLAGVLLLAVFLGGIGSAPSDNVLGPDYSEFLQAVRAPGMYRLFTTLDALGWLLMGGALLVLAAGLLHRSAMRAVLIAACGMGLLTGVVGGAVRLVGISDLAARYATAGPAQQVALLQLALGLREITGALFVVGDMLAGAGWLLVASVALTVPGAPRWLTAWFALAGGLSLLQGITSAIGMFSFPILLLTIVVGVLGLHSAIVAALWRPSPALVTATAAGRANEA